MRHGVSHSVAHQIAGLPPVASLFAAVLGVNPVQHLLQAAGALSGLPAASQRALTGRHFFPALISGPFHHGLVIVFAAAAGLAALAAVALPAPRRTPGPRPRSRATSRAPRHVRPTAPERTARAPVASGLGAAATSTRSVAEV